VDLCLVLPALPALAELDLCQNEARRARPGRLSALVHQGTVESMCRTTGRQGSPRW